MQENKNARDLQRRIFGERYIGASLSKITNIPGRSFEKTAKWLSNPKGFMVLVGPPGVGKTYFCSAILENIPKGIRFLRGYSEKDLLRRVRQSFSGSGNGDYVTYLQSLIDDDLVIIDDIGASGYTEWRDEILFDTVDYRYSTKKPTILTTNLTMKELGETYSHRLKSRIFASENTVIDMSDCSDLRQEGL